MAFGEAHIPFADRVKAVVETLPAVTLTPEIISQIASQIPPTDISGKVDKETNKALLLISEASKIHSLRSDDQDLSGLQPKETGKGLSANDYTTAEKNKLSGIAENAQVNADITKSEIEAKLTGTISSHSHAAGGLTQSQILRMI